MQPPPSQVKYLPQQEHQLLERAALRAGVLVVIHCGWSNTKSTVKQLVSTRCTWQKRPCPTQHAATRSQNVIAQRIGNPQQQLWQLQAQVNFSTDHCGCCYYPPSARTCIAALAVWQCTDEVVVGGVLVTNLVRHHLHARTAKV